MKNKLEKFFASPAYLVFLIFGLVSAVLAILGNKANWADGAFIALSVFMILDHPILQNWLTSD